MCALCLYVCVGVCMHCSTRRKRESTQCEECTQLHCVPPSSLPTCLSLALMARWHSVSCICAVPALAYCRRTCVRSWHVHVLLVFEARINPASTHLSTRVKALHCCSYWWEHCALVERVGAYVLFTLTMHASLHKHAALTLLLFALSELEDSSLRVRGTLCTWCSCCFTHDKA